MGAPLFSKRTARRIAREGGLKENDAVRIASTEMEGAVERQGTIDSTQTACPVLRYPENLPPSKGQREGKRKTLRDVGAASEKEADKIANQWVEKNGGWTK